MLIEIKNDNDYAKGALSGSMTLPSLVITLGLVNFKKV